mmetsp:Transcript_46396/g.84932  ORF Transcript_46396/g.84932 Transcript_46396/m.84932 type:complete len:440 (-) Transcript_46396:43-1362(-)
MSAWSANGCLHGVQEAWLRLCKGTMEASIHDADTARRYQPDIAAIHMPDPRRSSEECLAFLHDGRIGVVAFYYPDKNAPCDDLCKAYFLGNFWDDGELLSMEGGTYRVAEGAFQALKFWEYRHQFSDLDGGEVFSLKKQLEATQHVDRSYHGLGSNWRAMQGVLRAKFRVGSRLADALLATGDTYLVEHNSTPGRDLIWSDNHVGNGKNWLGMQLMLLRDALRDQRESSGSWTDFIENVCLIDLETGMPKSGTGGQAWSLTVQAATSSVLQRLPTVVPRRELSKRHSDNAHPVQSTQHLQQRPGGFTPQVSLATTPKAVETTRLHRDCGVFLDLSWLFSDENNLQTHDQELLVEKPVATIEEPSRRQLEEGRADRSKGRKASKDKGKLIQWLDVCSRCRGWTSSLTSGLWKCTSTVVPSHLAPQSWQRSAVGLGKQFSE